MSAHGVEFTVFGTPVSQGSKKGFVPKRKDGTPVRRANGSLMVNIVDDDPIGLSTWRQDIVKAARDAMAGHAPLPGPLKLSVVFTVKKPVSAPKTRRTWPETKPDLDKLMRAVMDALTTAGVYGDDAQVVEFGTVAKAYPNERTGSLALPGARIRVTLLSVFSEQNEQQPLLWSGQRKEAVS